MAENLSGEHLKMIFEELAKMNDKQQVALFESIKTLGVELRKPSDVEQAKIDEEKKKLEAKIRNRIALAQAEQQSKEMRKKGCGHEMPNGRHTWRGQVNSDGYIIPLCTICLTEMPRIKATQDQIANGVNFEAYRNLDLGTLERWSTLTNKTA